MPKLPGRTDQLLDRSNAARNRRRLLWHQVFGVKGPEGLKQKLLAVKAVQVSAISGFLLSLAFAGCEGNPKDTAPPTQRQDANYPDLRSKKWTEDDFKEAFHNKSKSEIKAELGPPDDAYENLWVYENMKELNAATERVNTEVQFMFWFGPEGPGQVRLFP